MLIGGEPGAFQSLRGDRLGEGVATDDVGFQVQDGGASPGAAMILANHPPSLLAPISDICR